MARIRREVGEDVEGLAVSAGRVFDWRQQVRDRPWLFMGVAVAVGYLIVPRRHVTVHRVKSEAKDLVETIEAKVEQVARDTKAAARRAEEAARPEQSASWLGWAFGLISPLALRAAQSYALGYVETMIAQNFAPMSSAPVPGGGAGQQPAAPSTRLGPAPGPQAPGRFPR